MTSTMFAMPSMYYERMKAGGIKVPEEGFDDSKNSLDEIVPFEQYPHANIYLKVHVGYTIDADALEDNARIIAALSVEELKLVSIADLKAKGVSYGIDGYWV